MKTFSLVILATILVLPVSLWGKDEKGLEKTIQKKKGDLTEIQNELREKRKEAHKKLWEQKKIMDSLDEIEYQLHQKEKTLIVLNAKKGELEERIADHGKAIAQLETLLVSLNEQYTSRVRAMYKLHRVGVVRILFSAEDYGDALRRYKAFQMVVHNDLEFLKTHQRALEGREERKKRLVEEERILLDKRKEIEIKQKEIAKEKRKKTILLTAVKEERAAYQRAIAELEGREKALRSLIEELSQKASTTPDSAIKTLRGKLAPPVEGALFIPQGRTKGIGFKAPEGTEIRSVFSGKVVYASWFKGYGNLMIIDHGGGYHTVFGHAARLLKQVGDDVQTGEIVALVGSTGSIEGPMLYFEIRHHGKCEDPAKWLARSYRTRIQ